jgi:ketosteroid isomerase-like protein
MGKTRNVVERFYERFGANDLDSVFACFAPECIAVGLLGRSTTRRTTPLPVR